jgi:HlyD family secretion protein
MKKRLILIFILLIIVVIGIFGWERKQAREDSTLTLYGNVDIRQVNLGFRVFGKLTKLLVDEGDPIKTGQILGFLDDEPYRDQINQAQATVEAMEAAYLLKKNGYRPQEIEQAVAQVYEQAVVVENARLILKRSNELVKTKGIPLQERDNSDATLKEAEAKLLALKENLSLLREGYRQEEIDQAHANLKEAKAALATAILQLQDTTLVAPSNGTILVRAQEPGAVLAAGSTVFTLSLDNPVWVRAYVEERNLGHIHPGMKVKLTTDSTKSFEGQIGFISPTAEFTPKTVETPELRTSLVYRLRIVVLNPDIYLRQGMPVTVTIEKDDNDHSTSR